MKPDKWMMSVIGCGLLAAMAAYPCTTFVLQGGGRLYFGRNLDWDWEDGLVVLNQRNVTKTAWVAPNHAAVKWTSKYGSVTFNQWGQELPYGGMNEAGLVVENMMLDESQYPAADSRPEIHRLQWIQYQLDNCRTVAEVLATDAKIRQEQPATPGLIHYFVCDASGDGATIEWLGGKMVCHRGPTLPYRALANSTYAQSVAYARTNAAPTGPGERLRDTESLPRFACAAGRAAAFQPRSAEADVAYAFETLEQVRQGKYTVWQMVYDITGRRIHYRTGSNPRQRTIELKPLNFACGRTVKFVHIRADASPAGFLDFQDLTQARQRQYLQTFMAQESVKREYGDLSPFIEPLLLTLGSYTCADREP
jgi:penicillin V acylase-like amidase (Ntn superfamily)